LAMPRFRFVSNFSLSHTEITFLVNISGKSSRIRIATE
jgi:hypothetical protein